jgi:hypothetical protein
LRPVRSGQYQYSCLDQLDNVSTFDPLRTLIDKWYSPEDSSSSEEDHETSSVTDEGFFEVEQKHQLLQTGVDTELNLVSQGSCMRK